MSRAGGWRRGSEWACGRGRRGCGVVVVARHIAVADDGQRGPVTLLGALTATPWRLARGVREGGSEGGLKERQGEGGLKEDGVREERRGEGGLEEGVKVREKR